MKKKEKRVVTIVVDPIFGRARARPVPPGLHSCPHPTRSRHAGTVTHIPPEIWKDVNQPRTVKYDVYSFAVLLWELLTEEEPFKNGISYSCVSYLAVM